MDTEERRALLALNCLPGLGPAVAAELCRQAGSAAAVLAAPRRWRLPWGRSFRVPDPAAALAAAEAEAERLAGLGARLVTQVDADYPKRFLHLPHPPPVVAVIGRAEVLAGDRRRIGLVGARACTPYGRSQAARFGTGFAVAGAVVVSGAARGIDQAGMAAALAAGGAVVAVLGSGLDRPYPPEARPLLERIAGEGGAVVSEFPCGTAPVRGNFPRRNRLIAALVDAVVVVEATRRSGSMITAGLAASLGREVFAVPGPLDSIVSRGPLALIREGAGAALGPEEVLADLEPVRPEPADDPLLVALERGDASLAELAAALGLPEDQILLQLVEHELHGRVCRRPSGLYHRCGPLLAARAPASPDPGPSAPLPGLRPDGGA
ncbi:MAG: DNA-protecting protein DprA [Planctomycetota bacterium]|nr:MAG: DNA-protecting protein DprA [Planctomycetota bacterium]